MAGVKKADETSSWYMIRTHRNDNVDKSLKELAALLTKEKDVPVSLAHAVRIALEEAIAARKKVRK